jgi:hypothetical protein
MKRLIALACSLGFCAPAIAADAPIAAYNAGGPPQYLCVGKETYYPTYPSWIFNPDPYDSVIPQFYSVVSWDCDHGRLAPPRHAHRRARPFS